MIAWLISVAVLAGVCQQIWLRSGPRHAIAAGVLLSLLVPQWVRWDVVSGVWINVTMAITICMLVLYLLHSQSTYDLRLRLCDWIVIAAMLVHLISDCVNDGFQFTTLLRIYGEWFAPYIAGRLAFQKLDDLRWALPLGVIVVVTLTTLGVLESVLKLPFNPFELVWGKRIIEAGIESNAADAARWGLKRAYGPLMHTLYFGVLQVMLMPWILYASQLAMRRQGEAGGKGWLWAIPITASGVASTLSRGPFLAIGTLVYALYWVVTPRNRFVLAVIGVVVTVAAAAISGPLLNQLDALTNEDQIGQTTPVGEEKKVAYSAAGHRKLLFTVYAYPMRMAGLLGYGTHDVSKFPPDVPLNQPVGKVKAVDNAYILFVLRFGYLGLVVFLALHIAAAWQFLRLADATTGDEKVWLGGMAAMVVSAMLMFMLVWMPQDIGFYYLFCLGISSGLVIDENPQTGSEKKRRRHRSSRTHKEVEEPVSHRRGHW